MKTADDCLIVGGGPGGLMAAIYLARFHRNVRVIDDGDSRASLISNSYNFPGSETGISGPELLEHLRKQARQFGATLEAGHVADLRRVKDGFIAQAGGREFAARTIILATGIVDEKPTLPSMRKFIYQGAVRFCPVCDGYEATDKRVGVMGPLSHAVKKALFMRAYTKDVLILPTDAHPKIRAEDREMLEAAGIPVPGEAVTDIVDTGPTVTAELANGERIERDVLYISMGAEVRTNLAQKIGAKTNDEAYLETDQYQCTNIPNLYAVGDITAELSQIIVALGQAAVAATHINKTLPPSRR